MDHLGCGGQLCRLILAAKGKILKSAGNSFLSTPTLFFPPTYDDVNQINPQAKEIVSKPSSHYGKIFKPVIFHLSLNKQIVNL
jgi:hypothetical protein